MRISCLRDVIQPRSGAQSTEKSIVMIVAKRSSLDLLSDQKMFSSSRIYRQI
jgi:hypothetical protein